jgi:hypothetical protein
MTTPPERPARHVPPEGRYRQPPNLNTYLLALLIVLVVLIMLGVGVTDAGEVW